MSSARTTLRNGIAAYFGGTLNATERAWQNGPLTSSGLGTVRAAWPKKLNDNDFEFGLPPGTAAGGFMVVELGRSRNVRRGFGGQPVVSNGVIVQGGRRFRNYRVMLQLFHMAQMSYAEDAQEALDDLIEAIEYHLMSDPTLGGICTQAGEGRFGINVTPGRPAVKSGRTGTWTEFQFDVLVQIMA